MFAKKDWSLMTQTIKKPNKSKKPRKSLSKAELGLISQLLLLAEREIWANSSMTYGEIEEIEEREYAISATEENKELMRQFILATYDEHDQELHLAELEEEKDEIDYGVELCGYLYDRCNKLSKS